MAHRTRGPGAQHEQRRNEIADAVLAIVADRGLAAVSQTAVAAQAGVSPGRVQHYFPAKQKLIEAAFERGNALSSTRIATKTTANGTDAGPRGVLTVVLTELIPYDAVTRAHLRVRQSFTAAALADDAIADRLRDDYARLHTRLAELLRQDQAAGRLRPGVEPDQEAVTLVALAEGLAYYVLIGVYPADAARDRLHTAISGLYR
ncbi:TetR/AcrR family transcriptional regulator [Actinoallomurus sp. NBC_01490]|uniref:TetR/AcrR family transcriptional regulator n=1 Tax=Actinoallomurus sp. NBC_01490 TaxID=2903557 RepID=UPI002E2FE4FA|nr:TetR/AcrR family transcriptional regulator [Actinoallomurus sp. NBC_01490]